MWLVLWGLPPFTRRVVRPCRTTSRLLHWLRHHRATSRGSWACRSRWWRWWAHRTSWRRRSARQNLRNTMRCDWRLLSLRQLLKNSWLVLVIDRRRLWCNLPLKTRSWSLWDDERRYLDRLRVRGLRRRCRPRMRSAGREGKRSKSGVPVLESRKVPFVKDSAF